MSDDIVQRAVARDEAEKVRKAALGEQNVYRLHRRAVYDLLAGLRVHIREQPDLPQKTEHLLQAIRLRNDDELDRWRRNRPSESGSPRWRRKAAALEPEPPREVTTVAWPLGFSITRYTGSVGPPADSVDDLYLLLDGRLACGERDDLAMLEDDSIFWGFFMPFSPGVLDRTYGTWCGGFSPAQNIRGLLAHAGESMPKLPELPDPIDVEFALQVYGEPLPQPPNGVPWVTR